MTTARRAIAADAHEAVSAAQWAKMRRDLLWEETIAALRRFQDADEAWRALSGEAEDAQEFVALVEAAENWRPGKETS